MGDEGLHPQIRHNIAQSEIEGGVWLKDVPVGKVLLVQTNNTLYRLEHREDGWWIQGHAKYCPEPTKTTIAGSTWGGSMLKIGWVGREMHLEFHVDAFPFSITTSTIQDVKEETHG
jgi:hypothetical protein